MWSLAGLAAVVSFVWEISSLSELTGQLWLVRKSTRKHGWRWLKEEEVWIPCKSSGRINKSLSNCSSFHFSFEKSIPQSSHRAFTSLVLLSNQTLQSRVTEVSTRDALLHSCRRFLKSCRTTRGANRAIHRDDLWPFCVNHAWMIIYS